MMILTLSWKRILYCNEYPWWERNLTYFIRSSCMKKLSTLFLAVHLACAVWVFAKAPDTWGQVMKRSGDIFGVVEWENILEIPHIWDTTLLHRIIDASWFDFNQLIDEGEYQKNMLYNLVFDEKVWETMREHTLILSWEDTRRISQDLFEYVRDHASETSDWLSIQIKIKSLPWRYSLQLFFWETTHIYPLYTSWDEKSEFSEETSIWDEPDLWINATVSYEEIWGDEHAVTFLSLPEEALLKNRQARRYFYTLVFDIWTIKAIETNWLDTHEIWKLVTLQCKSLFENEQHGYLSFDMYENQKWRNERVLRSRISWSNWYEIHQLVKKQEK